jgi:hypothetical protein
MRGAREMPARRVRPVGWEMVAADLVNLLWVYVPAAVVPLGMDPPESAISSLDMSFTRRSCAFLHTVLLRPADNEGDASDVGSMMSGHATAGAGQTPVASRPPPSSNLPPHSAVNAATNPSCQPSRRAAKRIEELSGEGSQSESLDSPT